MKTFNSYLNEAQKWMKAYRGELSGRGSTTDAIRGGIYFFAKKSEAELWAGKHGKVIERKIRIDTASIQEVGEGEVSGDGMDHDVVIRKDPYGSGKIMEIIVFNKRFIKPQLKVGTYQ